jgi:hypothetical protein
MAQEVNRRVAPTTGAGISVRTRVTIGKNANTAKMAKVAKATRRLATPVAAVRPT